MNMVSLTEIRKMVAKATEEHGWAFQEPYVIALKLMVCRRRAPNETQLFYWMAEADERQRYHAYCDAMAIIEAREALAS